MTILRATSSRNLNGNFYTTKSGSSSDDRQKWSYILLKYMSYDMPGQRYRIGGILSVCNGVNELAGLV